MDQRVKYVTNNYQMLEENTKENPHETALHNNFMDMRPKVQTTKMKISNSEYTENFWAWRCGTAS